MSQTRKTLERIKRRIISTQNSLAENRAMQDIYGQSIVAAMQDGGEEGAMRARLLTLKRKVLEAQDVEMTRLLTVADQTVTTLQRRVNAENDADKPGAS